jgi:uncharacterized protein (TIRG00374 family)
VGVGSRNSWRQAPIWIGVGVSGVAVWLVFRDIALEQLWLVFAAADYAMVSAAACLQLVVIVAIAARWRLLFSDRPSLGSLTSALFVAQLANLLMPLRLGMLVRAYLVARQGRRSKITVLGTVATEKVFDGLVLALLCAVVLPAVAPEWLASASGLRIAWFLGLMLILVLFTHQRRRLVMMVGRLLGRWPWIERRGLVQKVEVGMEGMAGLHGAGTLALLWASSLGIAGLGVLVNLAVLRAFHVEVPLVGAALLLVALQIGGRVLPSTPLGGVGLFQYICVQALALFGVSSEQAVSCGLTLHVIVMLPGALLGGVALWRTQMSLRRLESDIKEST